AGGAPGEATARLQRTMTMDLFEALETTRAIRRFTDAPVTDEEMRTCIRAATQAPSGGNIQPWQLLRVRDVEAKRAIAHRYRRARPRHRHDAHDRLPHLPGRGAGDLCHPRALRGRRARADGPAAGAVSRRAAASGGAGDALGPIREQSSVAGAADGRSSRRRP